MTAAVAYRSSTDAVRRRTSTRTTSRPRLRVLDQVAVRRRARRRNAVILLFLVLLSALFLVAFVHAGLVETQQELDEMRTRIAELRTERARLERAVDEASSPALIVDRADELGMVRAAPPVFLVSVEPGTADAGDVAEVPTDVAAPDQPAGGTGGDGTVEEAALGGSGDG